MPKRQRDLTEAERAVFNRVRYLIALFAFIPSSIVFIAACCGLAWTELSNSHEHAVLEKYLKDVPTVSADRIDPAYENKTVHVQGRLTGSQKLVDPEFGVSTDGLVLKRNVERRLVNEEWAPMYEDDAKPFQTLKVDAPKVHLGAYELDPLLTENWDLEKWKPILIEKEKLSSLPANKTAALVFDDEGKFVRTGAGKEPATGDQKITFEVLSPADVSVLAKQSGDKLTRFEDHAYISEGKLTSADMAATALGTSSNINTYLCRPPCLAVMLITSIIMMCSIPVNITKWQRAMLAIVVPTLPAASIFACAYTNLGPLVVITALALLALIVRLLVKAGLQKFNHVI